MTWSATPRASIGRAPGRRVVLAGLSALSLTLSSCGGGDGVLPPGVRGQILFQVPDTVFGRALTLDVATMGGDDAVGLSYSLDGGDPTAPFADQYHGGGTLARVSVSSWRVYVSGTLSPGVHQVTVTAFDGKGQLASRTASFRSKIDSVQYDLTALPTLGGTSAIGLDLNEAGVVAGAAMDAVGAYHAVLWMNGQPTRLPGDGVSVATALNDQGLVVGLTQDPRMTRECRRGAVWRNGGAPELLPDYPLTTVPDTARECIYGLGISFPSREQGRSYPVKVNNRGSILTGYHLVHGGSILDLIPRTSTDRVTSWALNDNDEVAISIAQSPAYEYNASAIGFGVTIGAPGAPVTNGSGPGRHYVWAAGINESGTVAGTESRYILRAFVSDPSGRTTDLGDLTGNLRAVDVNDSGDILLQEDAYSGYSVAPHLVRGGKLFAVALSEPGWTIVDVVKLNAAGQILAAGKDPQGASQMVLLTPRP